ncbi:MAG TPA: serine/threonine-protein kinase [Fimbriiglobus sp.]|jgi:tetratricopeptide (TPR) repeat protein|nr:serine/threonine-protein kinase [Fimbriiglobus sp.]
MIPNEHANRGAAGNPAARLLGLWHGGSAPDLDAFLAGSGDLSPVQLAAVLRVDQRERWQLGQHVPAECYLQRYPRVRDDEEGAIDLVYGEFLLREKGGAAPPVEEFLWRFPTFAAVLGPQIALHRAIRAAPAAAESGQQGETLPHEPGTRPAPAWPVSMPGYEILDELGRGGMGVVYRARQVRLKRLVAVKMLLAGAHAGADALARFRREAETAARLRHPNIVQVYEVGESDGRPFLALEYIDGGSLKDRLAGTPQPARWSAELLEVLARAVHFAHDHGVVHRDLKPSNILLAVGDGPSSVADQTRTHMPGTPEEEARTATDHRTPVVAKITDFGLAKQFGELATAGNATQTGDILGTPSYMSPEQATGQTGEIGPATDVYALGSILYELLTGRPPFLANSPLVTLQQVATEDPVSPSQLQRQLPRDLVTVCLKCLQKEPSRRYATAGELADDLRRFLNGESVRARPVGAAKRAWRWARRNPAVAGLTAALIVGSVGGLAVMTGLYLHARDQAGRALRAERDARAAAAVEVQARETAQARQAETTAVLRFVDKQILAAARPKGQGGGLGREVTLRRAVEEALPFVDQSFATEPLIEARLRMTLGSSFWYLGDAKKASEQYQRALTLYTQHLGPDHPDTLTGMYGLALGYADLGRHEDALKLHEETLALRKAKLGPDDPDTLKSMHGLATCYSALGRHEDALKLQEEVLALRRTKLGPDHPDTLRGLTNLAISYSALGRNQDALKLREEVLALRKAKPGPDHPETLSSMNNLANSYLALGKYTEAVRLHEETLARRKTQIGHDHPDTLSSMGNLAIGYAALGRHPEALKLREETLERWKARSDPDHPELLRSMHDLAMSYDTLGRHADAVQLHEEALKRRKAKLGPDHPDTLRSMHNLALSYSSLDRHEDALKLQEETLALRRAKLDPDHPDTLRSMNNLAFRYARSGRHQDALKLREETLARRKAKLGPDHPDTLSSMWNLASSLVRLDRGAEAVPIIDECLRRAAAGKDVDPRLIPWVMDLRLSHFKKARDAAGCRATAEMWENLNRTDADSLVTAARLRAVTAAVVRETDESEVAAKQADAEADRAMAWLKKAAAAGFKNGGDLKTNQDLDALRDHPEFQQLLADLEKK